MFSITTIESSTTRPMAIVSALRVRMFSEKPNWFSPINVTNTEVGIEIAVTMVERIDNRKTRIIRIAKPRPSSPSTVRFSRDFSTNGAWSKIVTTVTSPSFSFSSAIFPSTPLETATVFPS